MKKLLLLLTLVSPVLALAQAPTPDAPPAVNFCGIDLVVPGGCTPDNKYQVHCQGMQLTWMYLDYPMLKGFPDQFVRQLEKKHKHTEKQPLECFILETPAKGYRLSYPTEAGGMTYELVAYGIAKGQPVMVQVTLETDPDKTADLPALAQQIIRLPK
ncbi:MULTISPECIES: hypothetical protein [Hymenobacter]|uniref:Uncharacterized protein n=1 Tax=Hymenobacter mucosus TaxID=1411120 RepID=A0A238V3F0_9BACT|nr:MULTISPECIES: hypothetical protein [Hymenobacter]SNR28594.1 hypothetical protein SAMN06269173_10121 [Hymenobacter mucosus]